MVIEQAHSSRDPRSSCPKKDVSRKGGQITAKSVPLELASCTHGRASRAVSLKMCSIQDILDSKPLPGPNYSIQQLFSESVVTPSSLSAPVQKA